LIDNTTFGHISPSLATVIDYLLFCCRYKRGRDNKGSV